MVFNVNLSVSHKKKKSREDLLHPSVCISSCLGGSTRRSLTRFYTLYFMIRSWEKRHHAGNLCHGLAKTRQGVPVRMNSFLP